MNNFLFGEAFRLEQWQLSFARRFIVKTWKHNESVKDEEPQRLHSALLLRAFSYRNSGLQLTLLSFHQVGAALKLFLSSFIFMLRLLFRE